MNSRARILAAINHEEPDRVPTWFAAQEEITARLYRYFGVDNGPALRECLGCDSFASEDSWPHPTYVGPERFRTPDGVQADWFGIVLQKHWPLAFATTPDDLAAYRWPSADWFDYSTIKEHCTEQQLAKEESRCASRTTAET
jgi:uroporphyrinogen decarboxylase